MDAFRWFLRIVAAGMFVAGLVHVVFGSGADRMLGAGVTEAMLGDPGLDNQNRFYGAALWLYGVVLWIGAGDVTRHAPMLRASGFDRARRMAPSWILILGVVELALPPAALLWLRRVERVPAMSPDR